MNRYVFSDHDLTKLALLVSLFELEFDFDLLIYAGCEKDNSVQVIIHIYVLCYWNEDDYHRDGFRSLVNVMSTE